MDSREAYQQQTLFEIDTTAPELSLAKVSRKPVTERKKRKVDALTEIHDSPPEPSDLAYLLTIFANCYLPRTATDKRTYTAKSGNYGIIITGGAATNPLTGTTEEMPIPYGSKAREFISYINSEAVRTGSNTIYLGNSLKDLIFRITGQEATGGFKGNLALWKQQLMAFSTCNFSIEDLRDNGSYAQKRFNFIDEFRLWFPKDGENMQDMLFPTTIKLSDNYRTLLERQGGFPCDRRVLRQLAENTLAYDIYIWLCYRLNYLYQNGSKPVSIPWPSLKKQFGQDYKDLAQFKFQFKKSLGMALAYYPAAKVVVNRLNIELHASKPAVSGGNFRLT